MKTITSTIVLAVTLFLVGCGDGGLSAAEGITRDIMKNMKEMGEVMASITDEASAKAAVPKITAIRTNMREVAKRAQEAKVTKNAEAELEKKIGAERTKVMQGLMDAKAKLDAVLVQNPALIQIIGPALEGMENDM